MRTKLVAGFVRVLACCLVAPVAVAAQEPQEAPPVKLSLRVVAFAGAAPTFYPLPDKEKAGAGGIFGGFRRLPSAGLTGGQPVQNLLLQFRRERAGARVAVYVMGVNNSATQSIKVAEYSVAEGAEYPVARLADYGVEPITVAVVRRAEVKLVPPKVDDRTRAVEVGEIKIREEAPSFELTLRNASDKTICAVEVEEYRGWERKGPPPLYDWKSAPPVEPGKSWKVTLEFGWTSKATPEGHVVEPPDTVVIKSVLFSDGSYQGDSLFAARAEAFMYGRRTQLGRVLEILNALGEPSGPDAREAAKEFVTRVNALERVADWAAVNELAGRYPAARGEELDRIKGFIEAGMDRQRHEVISELWNSVIEKSPAADPSAERGWVGERRERYARLLAVLSPAAADPKR